MQTALQQAIEQIRNKAKYNTLQYQLACDDNIAILTALLPTERKIIEMAYDDGFNNWTDKSDYFTKKFNTNDTTKS